MGGVMTHRLGVSAQAGTGGGGYIGSEWRLLPRQPGPAFGKGYAELKFLTLPGDTVQPDTGTSFGAATIVTGSTHDKAFDGNTATDHIYQDDSDTTGGTGFTFDSDVTISAVRITARTGFASYTPVGFFIQYKVAGVWTNVCYINTTAWSSGEVRTFEFADYPDELGGHRFWAFKNTGNNYAAFVPCYQVELYLRASGVNIAADYATLTTDDVPFPTLAFDGLTADNYFTFDTIGAYLIVDFGRKRVVDEVGITGRNNVFANQMMKQFEIYSGDIDADLANMSLELSVNDVSGTPSAGETRYYSI